MKDLILKNYYAFELMMAPYAVGHLKMSLILEELGYQLEEGERFKLYLTNTLEMEELATTHLPGMASLSEESHLAGEVKKEKPILVIMGNPPYSMDSANKGEWISREIRAYYEVDGQPLRERQTRPLQDDYVKFIRFAQWKIEQTGEGILGFITNHNYIDAPVFRGMRQSLMNTFDEIYILNLHGSSLKRERSPDGSKDENVFDIRPGVAISLMIKKKREGGKEPCKVYYADVWGTRELKYRYLEENDITTTKWQELSPQSPFYFFIPKSEEFAELYERFIKITDIFPLHSVGVDTGRDKLTIRWTPEEVWQVVLNFSRMEPEMARIVYKLGKDTTGWTVEKAQKDLLDSGFDRKKIVAILYRPFDVRYTYYTGRNTGFHSRPRAEVMSHMLNDNLALVTIRRPRDPGKWRYAFVTDKIISGGTAITSLDRNYLFPLYVYRERKNNPAGPPANIIMLFEEKKDYKAKEANISPKLIEKLSEAYGETPSPEAIFFYIYAILYSEIFRNKYDEFLRADFPRIPFTKDAELFHKIAEIGQKLVELHLARSSGVEREGIRLQGKGDDIVGEVSYEIESRRLYINENQYFEDIRPEVWEYKIGAYQVCQKWLQDRKGKMLTLSDIKFFIGIITAIEKTMELQKEIDSLYPDVEKDLLNFYK